jgi:hypothetical protein
MLSRHPTLLDAFSAALEAQELAVTLSRSLTVQHSHLAEKSDIGVAMDAAAHAVNAGKIELAVEFVEQGKAIGFATLSRYRTGLEELQAVDKGLVERFKELSRMLDHTVVSNENDGRLGTTLPQRPQEEVTRSVRFCSEFS